MTDPQKARDAIDTFFTTLQPVLEAGFGNLSKSLKKSVEELTADGLPCEITTNAEQEFDIFFTHIGNLSRFDTESIDGTENK